MKRILFAMLISISIPASAQPPLHWGTETWVCGMTFLNGRIGDGRDVLLYQDDVTVTVTPFNGTSNLSPNLQRQGLVALYAPSSSGPGASTTDAPPASYNNEVDGVLWGINPKTMGLNPQVISKSFDFRQQPVLIPGGQVVLRTINGPTDLAPVPGDCLNLEIHQELMWEYASIPIAQPTGAYCTQQWVASGGVC